MVFHARQYDEITGDPLYDPNRHAYPACVEWEDGGDGFQADEALGRKTDHRQHLTDCIL